MTKIYSTKTTIVKKIVELDDIDIENLIRDKYKELLGDKLEIVIDCGNGGFLRGATVTITTTTMDKEE